MADPPLKIQTVKTSIVEIEWNVKYLIPLRTLVSNVHYLVTHTFAFSKYMFLEELEDNDDFDLQTFMNAEFFKEVFLSLLKKYNPKKPKKTALLRSYKELISKHRDQYFAIACIKSIDLKYANQIAAYESVKISTAYLNGVKNQFGNKIRMFLNMLFKKKERIASKEKDMKEAGKSSEESKEAVKAINDSISRAKVAISSRKLDRITSDVLSLEGRNMIEDFLGAYEEKYVFEKKSIYYDAKVSPSRHILAYYRLSKWVEHLNPKKSINCFPVRRTLIPSYMTIDKYILNTQIIRSPIISHLNTDEVWGAVVNLKSRPFRAQAGKSMTFRGMLHTDGVGVSILKQNKDTKKGGHGGGGGGGGGGHRQEEFSYIEKLPQEELKSHEHKCVLIDPGRRDLLFCLHEDSSDDDKRVYRYTSNQKAKELKTRKFRRLREELKPAQVQKVEESLSKLKSSTLTKEKFVEYLEVREKLRPVLQEYYENEDHRDEKEKRADNYPPFRKMKLSSYINQQQADKRLCKNLRSKFGNDMVIVIGNWSAAHVKYQEPIKGVGIRRMFRREGFSVFLIDECKTSSLCPKCLSGKLETFKPIDNPRPKQREKNPRIICHGLLMCKNDKCMEPVNSERTRLFNRDLAAVLNFRHILYQIRAEGTRPSRFMRPEKTTNKRSFEGTSQVEPKRQAIHPL